jgi:pimeloyl-ACP methyl ester carboxylesterase
MSTRSLATPVVFIPALLCDEQLYRDVIAELGDAIEPQVLLSPKPTLEESVADILARAPERFALVGTSYGGNLAIEVALAAPQRVTALWLMGCNPAAPQAGGPDLASGLEATPDAVFDLLAGLVVHKDATVQAAVFKAMAQRVGASAGAAQARAVASRQEAASRLGGLTMPALVLWGEQDALAPLQAGQALAAALPHAQFEVLPGCGHLPTLEKPAESAAMFARLLETAGTKRTA